MFLTFCRCCVCVYVSLPARLDALVRYQEIAKEFLKAAEVFKGADHGDIWSTCQYPPSPLRFCRLYLTPGFSTYVGRVSRPPQPRLVGRRRKICTRGRDQNYSSRRPRRLSEGLEYQSAPTTQHDTETREKESWHKKRGRGVVLARQCALLILHFPVSGQK